MQLLIFLCSFVAMSRPTSMFISHKGLFPRYFSSSSTTTSTTSCSPKRMLHPPVLLFRSFSVSSSSTESKGFDKQGANGTSNHNDKKRNNNHVSAIYGIVKNTKLFDRNKVKSNNLKMMQQLYLKRNILPLNLYKTYRTQYRPHLERGRFHHARKAPTQERSSRPK